MNRPDLVDQFVEVIDELAHFHNFKVEDRTRDSIRESLEVIFTGTKEKSVAPVYNSIMNLNTHNEPRPDLVDGIMDLLDQALNVNEYNIELTDERLRSFWHLRNELSSVFMTRGYSGFSGVAGSVPNISAWWAINTSGQLVKINNPIGTTTMTTTGYSSSTP